ncbi:sensor histidine kinase KdpD [Erysipelothrix urinaevulpis]|uniref:sensor histidine kinase n=1 Tax=Erysipelothrix urinaevulpis TaxID=2683717 RepID=UPI00135C0EA2|nr:HAMP domain-containing sensor histidine kinase [Erysipelothrix urinaevulpis]
MKLSRKVLIYTTITTFIAGSMIIVYFVFLLPGLYIDYKTQRYLDNILNLHTAIQTEEACQANVDDMFMLTSFKLYKEGYAIDVCNQYFSTTLTIEDPVLRQTFDEIRMVFDGNEFEDSQEIFNAIDFSQAKKRLESFAETSLIRSENMKFNHSFIQENTVSENFRINNQGYAIISSKVHDATNQYINYSVFNQKDDVFYITVASAMTPKLQELMPIILMSTPMIMVLLLLFAMVTAKVFSKMLATPIETLASQARHRDDSKDFVFKQKSNDKEFVILEDALNTMHHDLLMLINSYQEQNKQLSMEKEKQDIFIMNASHQLKTPIASANLLLEGMMGKVGPYKDVEAYLPIVQTEIIRMNTLVEAMLMTYQDQSNENQKEEVIVNQVIEVLLEKLNQQIIHKKLEIAIEEEQSKIMTDPQFFSTIVENIILNAIKYTEIGGKIEIKINKNNLIITNLKSSINEKIIDYITLPFVKDNHQQDSTGIGLYLVDTFVNMLEMNWSIKNTDEGVTVTLNYKENNV